MSALYLTATLPLCAAAGPLPGHAGEHVHTGTAHPPCHGPTQLDESCPCGCDDDDTAGVSGLRLGYAEPAADPAPDPVSSLRAWSAPGPQPPATPELGIDPVPI